jgi:glutathione S-transferase
MKPKLISFKLCPFVQKAILALLKKGVEYDIEYIDLHNPPDWFGEISPLGKVPVLVVGDQVLFESSVIVEYLDEVYGEPLHPANPLQKAQNRSWMEFGNECLMNGYQIVIAGDEAAFSEARDALLSKLDQLEKNLPESNFFNGDEPSLVDLSFAPLFQRIGFIDNIVPGVIDSERHPKVTAWGQNLLQLDIMPKSAVPELEDLYAAMMKKQGGYLGALLAT